MYSGLGAQKLDAPVSHLLTVSRHRCSTANKTETCKLLPKSLQKGVLCPASARASPQTRIIYGVSHLRRPPSQIRIWEGLTCNVCSSVSFSSVNSRTPCSIVALRCSSSACVENSPSISPVTSRLWLARSFCSRSVKLFTAFLLNTSSGLSVHGCPACAGGRAVELRGAACGGGLT
jgi:hypothetical protein